MTIRQIIPYQILDSRGEPTLLVVMVSDSGKRAKFAVPSGSSFGNDEATEKRDGQGAYDGKGVLSCIELIDNTIAPKFIGYPLDQLEDFDGLLIALDGSEKKENLGANTLLALSGAYLKLSALEKEQPLWQYIAEHNNTSPEFPQLFASIVGGGTHAPGLEIQEFMIVPQNTAPSAATQVIYEVYHKVRGIMENLYGSSAQLVGDEGGLAPVGTNTEVILEALSQLNGKVSSKYEIALDASGNNMYKDGLYNIETQKLHSSDLFKLYQDWDNKFNLYAIEDPFAENDLEGSEIIKGMATKPKPFLLLADDYTVTSKAKIEQLQPEMMFDGIVIKPNQVGTFTETFQAINAARSSKAKVIISQRIGETTDSLIADLAYGVGAMGLKIGAPARGERIAKYNRLLEIEADLDTNQKQSGRDNVVIPPSSTEKAGNQSNQPIPAQSQPQPVGAAASATSYQAPKSPLTDTLPTSTPSPAPVQPPSIAAPSTQPSTPPTQQSASNNTPQSPKPTLGLNS